MVVIDPECYSPLNVVCPLCHAAKGGKCLEKVRDGSKWIDTPHPERVELARKEAV